MRNAAAKTVWPLCETPSATSMAPVGVSSISLRKYRHIQARRRPSRPSGSAGADELAGSCTDDRLWIAVPATWSRYRLCTVRAPCGPECEHGPAHAAAIEVVGFHQERSTIHRRERRREQLEGFHGPSPPITGNGTIRLLVTSAPRRLVAAPDARSPSAWARRSGSSTGYTLSKQGLQRPPAE